jgi:hypothetical protein
MYLKQAFTSTCTTRQLLPRGICSSSNLLARRPRAFSTLPSSSSWTDQFLEATDDIRGDWSFNTSADRLRDICKADLVKGTDIRDNPQRFFEAHRILARHATNHGPGFWVRFTVHYNLFAGPIAPRGGNRRASGSIGRLPKRRTFGLRRRG